MVVKRYANRRLYDNETSSYVTLEALAERIRGGENITFVDAKTGADITQPVLAQIILESRGASKLLPVDLLYQLIRMQEDALAEFMGRYMSWALTVYQRMRSGAQAASAFNPLANVPFAATDFLARAIANAAGWGGGAPPPPVNQMPPPPQPQAPVVTKPPPPAVQPDSSSELAAMRAELDALKAALMADKKPPE